MCRMRMRRWSRASWMRAGKSSGRPFASISVSPAAAIPPTPGRCSTLMSIPAQRAAHLAAAPHWWRQGHATWQSAEIRGDRSEAYTQALTEDAGGLRIGVVREGFAWPGVSEPDVDAMVRDATQRLSRAGAAVSEISIPLHRDGIHIWNPIAVEGATMLMVSGNGMGTNWKGHYLTALLDFYGRSRRTRGNDLSETVKLVVLLRQYMQDNYHGRYYAKGQNLARMLRAAYDEALRGVDLLLMPTT